MTRGAEGFGMAIGHAPGQGGVCVLDVNSATSPAAVAGVNKGWLVKEVCGIEVGTKADVVDALETLGDAKDVEFLFVSPKQC